jgi:uncharacterized protein YaiI (UPF0178 family)
MTSSIIRMSHLQGNYMNGSLAVSFKSQRPSANHSRATSQDAPLFKVIKNESESSGTGSVSLGAVMPSQKLPQLIKVKNVAVTNAANSRESSLHRQLMNRGAPVITQEGRKFAHPKVVSRASQGLFSGETKKSRVTIPDRTRQLSFESDCSTTNTSHKSIESAELNPFEPVLPASVRMNRDLVSDYGVEIESYLRKLEQKSALNQDHLAFHDLKSSFRARMVDWMTEVLNIAFKNICTDQTLFLAVSILDRYIQALEQRGQVFKASDLHLTGVVCMFIASKYEDVQPLLLRTVFEKIGHSKLSKEAILAKE